MSYIDFKLQETDFGTLKELDKYNSLINAIKNIILSKPGNYALTPSLGINIEKYLGEIGDDITLNKIKSDIKYQINKYIPNSNNVEIDTSYVDTGIPSSKSIGIKIKMKYEGKTLETGIIVSNENDNISVIVDNIN